MFSSLADNHPSPQVREFSSLLTNALTTLPRSTQTDPPFKDVKEFADAHAEWRSRLRADLVGHCVAALGPRERGMGMGEFGDPEQRGWLSLEQDEYDNPSDDPNYASYSYNHLTPEGKTALTEHWEEQLTKLAKIMLGDKETIFEACAEDWKLALAVWGIWVDVRLMRDFSIESMDWEGAGRKLKEGQEGIM